MNKKGFTLIELLAVVALLAILIVVAVPNVLDMFRSAKKSTFKSEVLSILREANADYIANTISEAGVTIYSNYKLNNEEDVIELSVNTSLRYRLNLGNNGVINSLEISGENFCYQRDTGDIKYTDVEIDPYITSGPC